MVMIKKEYICNFCRNTHYDHAEIYGTLWLTEELSIVDKSKSENHLCETCLDAISNAYEDFLNVPKSEG